jgi:hypothetical protein
MVDFILSFTGAFTGAIAGALLLSCLRGRTPEKPGEPPTIIERIIGQSPAPKADAAKADARRVKDWLFGSQKEGDA